MCERTCPHCSSQAHYEQYGIFGLSIECSNCGATLARRRDISAAPLNLTDEQADEWQREGTFVIPGAEAIDPADDELFRPAPRVARPEADIGNA